MSKSINYHSLVAHLTDSSEGNWILDSVNSEDDAYMIFNNVEATDCVTVQVIEGAVIVDSLRNDDLFDGSVEEAIAMSESAITA